VVQIAFFDLLVDQRNVLLTILLHVHYLPLQVFRIVLQLNYLLLLSLVLPVKLQVKVLLLLQDHLELLDVLCH